MTLTKNEFPPLEASCNKKDKSNILINKDTQSRTPTIFFISDEQLKARQNPK